LLSLTSITATQAGSLVNISFHVLPGAPIAVTTVQLVNSVTPNGRSFSTEVDDAQGALILSPGVDSLTVQTGFSPVALVADLDQAAWETWNHLAIIDNVFSQLGVQMYDCNEVDGTALNDILA